ncbi:MAG TPA: hypothetical protein VKB88_17375 [Bryobacteraceae bacterium]|nr:hypothetical protein [Bryobacteraceae bacterium]
MGASAPPPPPQGQGYPPPPGQGYAPPQPGYAPPAGYAPPPAAAPMADNVAGALCYVLGFVTGIIFLVMQPYSQNRNIRFHAFQSIFLSVAYILVRIILGSVVASIFFTGYHFGTMWMLWGLFWTVIGLGFLVLWLYMLIQTYQGRTVVLPIIGPLAQKQA